MPAERGFTLIEILVVVVIISITLGFAMLAFGDFGANRRAVVTAEQFSSYVKLVQQQAVLETNTLGINISKDGYGTYRFGRTWELIPTNNFFHWRSFPNNIIVTLKQGSAKNKLKNPDIIITPSWDMNEFAVDFGTPKNHNIITLFGKNNGQIIIQQPKQL